MNNSLHSSKLGLIRNKHTSRNANKSNNFKFLATKNRRISKSDKENMEGNSIAESVTKRRRDAMILLQEENDIVEGDRKRKKKDERKKGKEKEEIAVEQSVQDIIGTLSELENLNEEGRSMLSALRRYIGLLDDCANDDGNPEIAREVELHRQIARTLRAFRRANIATMLEIEKIDKEELFPQRLTSPQTELIHPNSTKDSRSVTSIHLPETTQYSAGNKILLLFLFAFFISYVLYMLTL